MVTVNPGPALPPFAGLAQPQHSIPGPGSNAFWMLAADDPATWLVSPGVYDCAILTIVHAVERPDGPVIGGRRPGGGNAVGRGLIRAMAHFNPFSGPRKPTIAQLFADCLAGYAATVNDLEVTIAFNAGARAPYVNRLASDIGEAVPALIALTTRGFGVASMPGQPTRAVTIYLSPAGQLSASQQ